MTLAKQLISALMGYLVGLFARESAYSPASSPEAGIAIDTRGAFWTTTALRLDEGLGWSSNATRFSSFHRQPAWRRSLVNRMKIALHADHRAEAWVFEPTFYYFGGSIPISPPLACPHTMTCLLTAAWRDKAWVTSRIMSPPKGDRFPSRIDRILANTSRTAHLLFVSGPRIGRIHFNPIHLGMRASAVRPLESPLVRKPCLKLSPLTLPSGLPDGILSFH